ncbi:signal peptidase II [Aggregatilineales bacterium SYSU G02658]
MTRRKFIILVGLVGLILLIDQLSKNWVLANMQLGQTILVVPALHPFFQFTFSTNTGAAFGLLPMAGDVFMVAAMLISVVIFYFYWHTPDEAVSQQVGLALILGGAIGNIIDRVQHGFVVDFFHLMIPGVVSNISNFADHFIVAGAALLLIDTLRRDLRRKAQAAPSEAAPTD